MTPDEIYFTESFYSTRHRLSFIASFVKINNEAKNVMAKKFLRQKEKEIEKRKDD